MHRGHRDQNSYRTGAVEQHGAAARAEHHATAATGRDRQASAPGDCRLTGGCNGPMAALFVLLSNHGILPESTSARPAVQMRVVVTALDDNLVGHFESPDPPPPRA